MDNTSDQKRIALFFFGCIPVRSALAWWAWRISNNTTEGGSAQRYALAVLASLIGIGLIAQARRRDIANENTPTVVPRGGFGGEVYWNSYVHGGFYLLFALLFMTKFKNAWFVLVIDIIFAIVTVINHYFN